MRDFAKALALSPVMVPWRILRFIAWLAQDMALEFTCLVLDHDGRRDGWGCRRCGVIWR